MISALVRLQLVYGVTGHKSTDDLLPAATTAAPVLLLHVHLGSDPTKQRFACCPCLTSSLLDASGASRNRASKAEQGLSLVAGS